MATVVVMVVMVVVVVVVVVVMVAVVVVVVKERSGRRRHYDVDKVRDKSLIETAHHRFSVRVSGNEHPSFTVDLGLTRSVSDRQTDTQTH